MLYDVTYSDLGTMPYGECRQLQQRLFDELLRAKAEGREADGHLLFVEHPPVYTLGKSGKESNLLVTEEYLRGLGAEFYRIDRGGDITFHGPGQLVVYPILDLERAITAGKVLSLKEYIAALEQAVINTVSDYGITAGRIEGASGVWVDAESPRPRKICAIGVRASRYVTMHGLALNVTTDLNWFRHINPCGFTDRGVTSIAEETEGRIRIDMEHLKSRLLTELLGEINLSVKRRK